MPSQIPSTVSAQLYARLGIFNDSIRSLKPSCHCGLDTLCSAHVTKAFNLC